MALLVAGMVTCVACVACTGGREEEPRVASDEQVRKPDARTFELHPFDPARIQAGDRIVGLRVQRAHIERAYDSTYVGEVEFAGPIRIRGTTRRHPDSDLADLVCFDVDSASVARLPRWPLDERRVWLCFENGEDALRMLGREEGRNVTVVIDGYTTVRHYSDAFDTARLMRVEEESSSSR